MNTSSSEIIAQLSDVHKVYPGDAGVKGVSLEVQRGEVVLITGESGSGKSTLIRLLSGIEAADSGAVELFGEPLSIATRKAKQRRDALIASRVGIGFQAPRLAPNMTVRENMAGLAKANGHPIDYRRAASFALHFGLADRLDQKTGQLSGGQKLRVALSRMLIAQPELVLLDEPTGMLDHEGKAQMFEDIAYGCRNEGMTALIVTHDLEPARAIADRELEMRSGQLISERLLQG